MNHHSRADEKPLVRRQGAPAFLIVAAMLALAAVVALVTFGCRTTDAGGGADERYPIRGPLLDPVTEEPFRVQ